MVVSLESYDIEHGVVVNPSPSAELNEYLIQFKNRNNLKDYREVLEVLETCLQANPILIEGYVERFKAFKEEENEREKQRMENVRRLRELRKSNKTLEYLNPAQEKTTRVVVSDPNSDKIIDFTKDDYNLTVGKSDIEYRVSVFAASPMWLVGQVTENAIVQYTPNELLSEFLLPAVVIILKKLSEAPQAKQDSFWSVANQISVRDVQLGVFYDFYLNRSVKISNNLKAAVRTLFEDDLEQQRALKILSITPGGVRFELDSFNDEYDVVQEELEKQITKFTQPSMYKAYLDELVHAETVSDAVKLLKMCLYTILYRMSFTHAFDTLTCLWHGKTCFLKRAACPDSKSATPTDLWYKTIDYTGTFQVNSDSVMKACRKFLSNPTKPKKKQKNVDK